MDDPTEFELGQWQKEASRLIVCTGCYGSGEDRWNQGRSCQVCKGVGRSSAEPHVIRLVNHVLELRKRLEEK